MRFLKWCFLHESNTSLYEVRVGASPAVGRQRYQLEQACKLRRARPDDSSRLPANLGPVRYRVLNGLGQTLTNGQATPAATAST